MNKVILMGRLTRDPEVRYSQGDNAMAIADIHWLWIGDLTAIITMRIPQTLSDALHSARAQSSQSGISIREPKLWRPAESRLVAMSIRMASKCIRLMLLWKIRSLQRARTVQPVTMGVTMAAVITVHLQDLSLLQRQTAS